MYAVAFSKVVQNLFGMRKEVWLGRSSVHEVLLKGSWDLVWVSSSMRKNSGEAFAAQSMLVNFAQIVVVPKLEVDFMKGAEKLFEGWDAYVLQGIYLEEFEEGFAYVSVVIPEGMVKIEKEVLVVFQGGLTSVLVILNFVGGQFPV